MAGTLRFASGVLAQFDCALTLERREACEAAGTEATLFVDSAFLPGTAPVAIVERRGREAETRHETPGADEYRLMVEHFADAVVHDRKLRYGALEAAANMTTIEALYRSARGDGLPVPVAPRAEAR
jgi:predicted dehydrogenase